MIRAEGVNISPEARQSAIENARRATGELSTLKLAA
jgi:FMN-dependent NADH-azoreductase